MDIRNDGRTSEGRVNGVMEKKKWRWMRSAEDTTCLLPIKYHY